MTFGASEVTSLERTREFHLIAKNVPCLNLGEIGLQCETPYPIFICFYKSIIKFTNSEIMKINHMKVKLEMSIKKTEISLKQDDSLLLSRVDKRDTHFVFETPRITMGRQRQREEDREREQAIEQKKADLLAEVFGQVLLKQQPAPALFPMASRQPARYSSSDSDRKVYRKVYSKKQPSGLKRSNSHGKLPWVQPFQAPSPPSGTGAVPKQPRGAIIPIDVTYPPPPPGHLQVHYQTSPVGHFQVPPRGRTTHEEEKQKAVILTQKMC